MWNTLCLSSVVTNEYLNHVKGSKPYWRKSWYSFSLHTDQTYIPHLVGDTCLVIGKHYCSIKTLHRKNTTVQCTGGYPAIWGEKWTPPGSSITLAASYAAQKMKKGETNGKANQLHEKESCHLSNIHRSVMFFFFFLPAAHIFKIEFWKPYTLLTAFMLYQLTVFFSNLLALFLHDKI